MIDLHLQPNQRKTRKAKTPKIPNEPPTIPMIPSSPRDSESGRGGGRSDVVSVQVETNLGFSGGMENVRGNEVSTAKTSLLLPGGVLVVCADKVRGGVWLCG